MSDAAVRYREYPPGDALRGRVRAFFSFSEPSEGERGLRRVSWEMQFGAGERVCAPGFADAHACIVFSFEKQYCPDGIWRTGSGFSRGEMIGPMTAPSPPSVPARRESIGVYFRAGALIAGPPLAELENRAVALEDLWGVDAIQLAEELSAVKSDGGRIDLLESALARRLAARRCQDTSLDISAVTAQIMLSRGYLPVEQLARAAGCSRQHFTRVFRENVGVSPKVYSELARLESTLGHLRRGGEVEWAQVAAESCYADQSHMISEFRRFTGMTPEALRHGKWFHPFIERSARRIARMPLRCGPLKKRF